MIRKTKNCDPGTAKYILINQRNLDEFEIKFFITQTGANFVFAF